MAEESRRSPALRARPFAPSLMCKTRRCSLPPPTPDSGDGAGLVPAEPGPLGSVVREHSIRTQQLVAAQSVSLGPSEACSTHWGNWPGMSPPAPERVRYCQAQELKAGSCGGHDLWALPTPPPHPIPHPTLTNATHGIPALCLKLCWGHSSARATPCAVLPRLSLHTGMTRSGQGWDGEPRKAQHCRS